MSAELPATDTELFENWTIQMRKGVLDLCILRALAGGEWYGYALVKALVAIPGVGVAEGSIYPLLARLKKQGLVSTRLEESAEGPARKYYRLTPAGQALGTRMAGYFQEMVAGLGSLGGHGAGAGTAAAEFTGPSSDLPTAQAEFPASALSPDISPNPHSIP